ncbi:UNVERIFIED_ORG: MFS transporter (plasmid) [Roseateles sp. XES5]|nr:MFS transporter [Roseateles sp. XES5]
MDSGSRRGLEITLLFTAFIAATYGFGLYLFPAMIEPIRADIGFSYGAMGVVSGLAQAGFMISALLAGFATLRIGALPTILGAIALCALCLAGLSFAPNVVVMAALLTLLGGCAAAIWVPMVDVARQLIPKTHQGKALGLMSSGTSYGVFLNSVLLTGLAGPGGWRMLWLVTGVLAALLALAGFWRLRGLAPARSAVQAPGPSIRARLRAMPAGLTAAVLLMMFLNGLACMPFQTYLSAFLQGEAGYPAETAAWAWRIIGLVGMVSGFAVGALADHITLRWGMVVTYLILAGACQALITVGGGEANLRLTLAAVAFGLSFYAIFGLVPAYIGQMFGAGSAALVFAFGNIALGLGGILGNVLGGMLKTATGSFLPAYLVMAGAAVASALLALSMPGRPQEREPAE